MRPKNLRQLEMTLLLVFDALLDEGSVTRTAKNLGLTQAGVSHALGRLRQLFGDPLFVRANGLMQPTARALEVADSIKDALARLTTALAPSEFNPRTCTETFRLLATDYFAQVALPGLVSRLEREAPATELRVISNGFGEAGAMLDNNRIDFAAGIFKNRLQGGEKSRYSTLTLFEDKYVCVLGRNHPFASKRMSKSQYLAAKHILFSPTGKAESGVERYFGPMGIRRDIALILNHQLAAPEILQRSNMIMTISSRIAQLYVEKFDLCMKPLPIQLPATPVQLIWSAHFNDYPPNAWFRSLIVDACADI
jgi:DNA-binding transcriptional LysR family regulator